MLRSNAVQQAVVCEAPLEFDYADGLFYSYDPTVGVLRAFRPEDFFATLARAAECARGFRFDTSASTDAEVIPIERARAGREQS